MPLIKSGSKAARQTNIQEMIASGHPPNQAVAAAYSNQREYAGKGSSKMAKNWIQGAIKHPGALHKQLGVPQGKNIPAGKLEKAAHAGGKLGQRARLAETLKGLHHGGDMHKGKGSKAKMPAQHHDKAHPKGPKHPPSHTYHKIMHGDHHNKMSEG